MKTKLNITYISLIIGILICSIADAQVPAVLKCLRYSGSSNVTMVGEDGVIINTIDNGKSWREQNSGITNVIYGFSSPDAVTSIAVGENGLIIRSPDGGINWNIIHNTCPETLLDVSAVNNHFIAACGELGTILISTNSGLTWSKKITGVICNIYNIHFIDENTGFAVGDNSLFLKTTNKGENWVKKDILFEPAHLKAVFARNINKITVAGERGIILNSFDGGITWHKPVYENISSTLNDIVLLGDNDGIIAGNDGIVLKTNDSGLSWYRVGPLMRKDYNFLSVSFSSPENGMLLCENGTVYISTDSGENWIEISKPFITYTNEKINASNYPNPFNPSTVISFELPSPRCVNVIVYDITGKAVAVLYNGYALQGAHHINFNAAELSSGIYLLRINSGGNSVTKKMILAK